MNIPVVRRPSRAQQERADRYMQEIRDVVTAGLSRRELLRMGLVMGAEGLAMKHSLRNFRPYWAYADDGGGGVRHVSPPNTPFVDPLPIPRVVQPCTLNPVPTKSTGTVRSAQTGYFETPRPDHQRWTEFGGSDQPGYSGIGHELVERAVQNDFYPLVDGHPSSTIWTYVDCTTLGGNPLGGELSNVPLAWIHARYGKPIVLRVHNALPEENEGFGINQTTTHLHNGHHASESDGGPVQFYDAGFYKDFHYANARAGFSKTHPQTTLNGKTVIGNVAETMSSLWFHDHRFGFTAQNVHKGLVGFLSYFSDDITLDCNDETVGRRLPSGDCDIPMILIDRTFDSSGALFFDLFNLEGILGDKYTVNGKIQPYLEVKRRKYRFRLLDGGPSRAYTLFLSNGQPFTLIASDGNLLPRPLTRQSVTMGVAERVDVIVDFSTAKSGDLVYLQNRLEQTSGAGPTGRLIAPTNILQFRVTGDAVDNSVIPPTLLDAPAPQTPVRTREWEFDRDGGAWVINGEPFDPTAIRATMKLNTTEHWTLKSGGGWMHPVHIHMEEFAVLSRDGNPPPEEERGRKDVIRIGQASLGARDIEETRLAVHFRDWLGDYPMHCHNTIHEDHAMLLRWQIVE